MVTDGGYRYLGLAVPAGRQMDFIAAEDDDDQATPSEPHRFPIRIYYEDTDAGGIVYHANYLKFAERGRTEWLRSGGWDHQRVAREWNIYLIVRHVAIDYKTSARLDDLLEIETSDP